MAWGGGWGNHAPETARTVAKAFFAGEYRTRGNCHTDGFTYWLDGHAIARRTGLTAEQAVIQTLKTGQRVRQLEFSFAGWPTKMTARHLSALGINAMCYGIKNPDIRINGKPVKNNVWYTLAEIAELPEYTPPAKKPRLIKDRFVNLTAELPLVYA